MTDVRCVGVQHVLRLPNLAAEVAAKGQQARRLLDTLLSLLLAEEGTHAPGGRQVLLGLVTQVPMPDQAESIASGLLQRVSQGGPEEDAAAADVLQQLLRWDSLLKPPNFEQDLPVVAAYNFRI